MQNIMRTLLAVMLASLGAKLVLEGTHTLPKYCRKRGARVVGKQTVSISFSAGMSTMCQQIQYLVYLQTTVWSKVCHQQE